MMITLDKKGTRYLIFQESKCCGYSLEVPRNDSNEYYDICSRGEINKISIHFG